MNNDKHLKLLRDKYINDLLSEDNNYEQLKKLSTDYFKLIKE